MATRKKPTPETKPSLEKIKSFSHDVLLAGIGAWARSRSGESRKGKGLPDFATLVKEGRKAEPEVKASMQKTWDEWKQKSQSLGSGNRFAMSGDKLRSAFDERVSAAIGSLGLPTRKEIEALKAKIDSLQAERTPARRRAAKKAAPRKATAASKTTRKAATKRAKRIAK